MKDPKHKKRPAFVYQDEEMGYIIEADPHGWTIYVDHRSLTTLLEKLIKIGAKVVSRARYMIHQMAEVAVPRRLLDTILRRIRRLRSPAPVPT